MARVGAPYFWCHIVEIKDYLTVQYALYGGALLLSGGGGLLEKLEVHLVHPCTGQISTALFAAMH